MTVPHSIPYHEIHQFVIRVKTFLCESEQTFLQVHHIKANNSYNTLMVVIKYAFSTCISTRI